MIFSEGEDQWNYRTGIEINSEGRVVTFNRDDYWYYDIDSNWINDSLGFGNFTSNTILDTNKWHHITYVGEANYRKLYISLIFSHFHLIKIYFFHKYY